jgi:predicted metal-binding membrane protein
LVAAFAGFYLIVWSVFGALAASAEWLLSNAGYVQDGKLSDPFIAGALIVIAGLYQWTAVKAVCLAQCHAPMDFVLERYRRGFRGAAKLGLEHSRACVGCCWLLMLLAFVGGSMHLGWMVVLTVFVAMERLLGARTSVLRLSAIVLLGVGVAQMLTSAIAFS